MTISAHQPATIRTWPWMKGLFWATMLLMSSLPTILWSETTGESFAWLVSARQTAIVIALAATYMWQPLKPARPFFAMFGVLFLAQWIFEQVGESRLWQQWFEGAERVFVLEMMSVQLRRFAVSLVMIVALFLLKRNHRDFFLQMGDLRARAERVRWLAMSEPISWSRFGPISIAIASGMLLTFLFLAGRPAPALLLQALPFLPLIVLFAMMNAWSEEISYRASVLATSESIVGPHHALWLSAIYFGIMHYYGVPYGITGVLLASFFGYILGKGMLETRGLFWSWLSHVVADVWIFSFMAVGSITSGG